ncbi:MAG: glutathione synthase/RimK-type ligase-like ATP-grasp enzyme [Granulosicoccus sp.]|jgi:glutathione synthase/RimK-type ligase-like ATP-grasp enzyme
MKYDITILTDRRWINPEKPDWYSDQIVNEDLVVQKALEKHGLNVTRTNWDNTNFDWSETRFALFRTVWDYSERWDEFLPWFKRTEKLTQFINPAEQIHWNLDKHYLQDLADKGVNIPPTVFLKKGSSQSLIEIFNEAGWSEAVLKPAISAGGRETYRITKNQTSEFEGSLRELLVTEDMMLQEFQQNVVEKGEVSMMFAGSKITHSIIKNVKAGDFRVQDDFGGTVKEYLPSDDEINFAQKVLSSCKNPPILGRVDMIWDNQGQLAVGELEIIEPEMWFRFSPKAALTVAETIFKEYF